MSEIREPTPLTLIREHPDNWCELMREKRVKVREKGSLALLHYDTAPDWADPVVLESRGPKPCLSSVGRLTSSSM